jgi:DNA (cytosine-5)-methyltransferase 1
LPDSAKANWVWWNIAAARDRNSTLADLIEDEPTNCQWHSTVDTEKLLGMMNALHLQKIKQASASGKRCIGTIYKRTRPDENGIRRQRAEVRFDDIAGCLRTPGGGSSRQVIIVVEGESVRSRLLSPREAARLMGLSDEYMLPARYNDAYHVAGDGVCVPVVRHIAEHLLEPILDFCQAEQHADAA